MEKPSNTPEEHNSSQEIDDNKAELPSNEANKPSKIKGFEESVAEVIESADSPYKIVALLIRKVGLITLMCLAIAFLIGYGLAFWKWGKTVPDDVVSMKYSENTQKDYDLAKILDSAKNQVVFTGVHCHNEIYNNKSKIISALASGNKKIYFILLNPQSEDAKWYNDHVDDHSYDSYRQVLNVIRQEIFTNPELKEHFHFTFVPHLPLYKVIMVDGDVEQDVPSDEKCHLYIVFDNMYPKARKFRHAGVFAELKKNSQADSIYSFFANMVRKEWQSSTQGKDNLKDNLNILEHTPTGSSTEPHSSTHLNPKKGQKPK